MDEVCDEVSIDDAGVIVVGMNELSIDDVSLLLGSTDENGLSVDVSEDIVSLDDDTAEDIAVDDASEDGCADDAEDGCSDEISEDGCKEEASTDEDCTDV